MTIERIKSSDSSLRRRQKKFLCVVIFTAFSVFSYLLFPCASSDAEASAEKTSGYSSGYADDSTELNRIVTLKNIAILPLENLSENPVAHKLVYELMKEGIKNKGVLSVTDEGRVEEFLAKRRIRYTGGITRITVREMGKVLGVDAVLVGSIAQFSHADGKLAVGILVRLISTVDGGIIWADSLSYTGKDFIGLLGLGEVTSIDTLSSLVVRDLINEMRTQFVITNGTGASPFEIEKVSVFPSTMVRGGERINLRVKTLSISDEPGEVRAIIGDREFKLDGKEGGEYSAYINAPDEEDIYAINVIIASSAITTEYRFEAAGKIVVDNTPPAISLMVSKEVFSPQRRGFVLFTPRQMSIDSINEWIMEIFDKEGVRVRGDKGYSTLPKMLIWRGETDKFSMVSDGEYNYKFAVRDLAGNESVLTGSLRVKNKAPVIDVDVETVEDKLLFSFDYSDDERIKSWKLSIIDEDGVTIKTMEGKGEFPAKVEYPIEQGTDINKISFSVSAIDDADNPFNLIKSVPAILSKKAPFAKVNLGGQLAEDF